MNYLNFRLDDNTERKIILHDGFSVDLPKTNPLHKHSYTEIHTNAKGTSKIVIENETYTMEPGSIIAIPPKKYHSLEYVSTGSIRNAFQVDCDCREPVYRKFSAETLIEFYNSIEANKSSNNYSQVFSYISLIISNLIGSYHVKVHDIKDDSYLINQFFEMNYDRNVQVSDLAETLHLSEKQTQLLMKRYFGKTFKQELADYRIKMADYLISTTDLTMSEIAYKVGFQTYSGFWKMYKTYHNNE